MTRTTLSRDYNADESWTIPLGVEVVARFLFFVGTVAGLSSCGIMIVLIIKKYLGF